MASHDTPVLAAALTQLYDEIFDHDDNFTFKKETSATEAFLLLSRYYRCTGNAYFLRKIEEVYHSVNSSEGKWRNDLWQPGLVEFAYSLHELTDPAKVVKEVLIKWSKQNIGYTVGVNLISVSALKEALLATGRHVNHESAYEFIVKSCAHMPPSFIRNNPDPDILAVIIEKVLSSMHHHITSNNHDDPLHDANNYFILSHLALCQKQFMADLMAFDRDLDRVERSETDCDMIMRAMICDSGRLSLILSELGWSNPDAAMDYRSMRRAQMSIISKFTPICRSKFFAKLPTTWLFDDISEELNSFGVRTEDLSEIARMLGIDWAELEATSSTARYYDEDDWSEDDDEEEREPSEDEGEDEDEGMEDRVDTDLESCDEDHDGLDSCDEDQDDLEVEDHGEELEVQVDIVSEEGRDQQAEMFTEEADLGAVQLDSQMSDFQDDIDGGMDSW